MRSKGQTWGPRSETSDCYYYNEGSGANNPPPTKIDSSLEGNDMKCFIRSIPTVIPSPFLCQPSVLPDIDNSIRETDIW